jgi:signal peptidase
MEPGIYRGDLLFLSNNMPQNYVTGDITVYQVAGEAIQIVHRVVETHNGPEASCVPRLASLRNLTIPNGTDHTFS